MYRGNGIYKKIENAIIALKGVETMKTLKYLACAAAAVACVGLGAYAANGDVCGRIYSTDIVTYINGYKAPSYNIGGRTAIVIEDMYEENRGISYEYNDETRTLRVDADFGADVGKEYEDAVKISTPGMPLGDVYETDIRVILNGSEVNGYNIGGKTAVVVEDMGDMTDSPNTEYGYSKYLARYVWSNDDRTLKMKVFNTRNNENGFSVNKINLPPNMDMTLTDDVVSTTCDRLKCYYHGTWVCDFSEKFIEDAYIIKPFYYSDGTENGEKTQLGIMYINGDGGANLLFSDKDRFRNLAETAVEPPMSNEEVFALLDDGKSYRTVSKTETESYWFLWVNRLGEDGATVSNDGILVKKSGGYGKIWGAGVNATELGAEKTAENTVTVSEYPFGGPRGQIVTVNTTLDLYSFDDVR